MVVAPEVSVVVPAYNNVRLYIRQAMTSLERQSFQEFEAIVVDDGSTDNTAEVLRPFKERDSRFQSLLDKQNGRLSSACNYDLHDARTSIIALLDGDEAYKQDKLATHVARFTKRSQSTGGREEGE